MKNLNNNVGICLIIKFIFCLSMPIFPTLSYSQDVILYKGKVVSQETKKPIAGVSIIVKEQGIKSTTDKDGLFTLKSNSPSMLTTFRHFGYKSLVISLKYSSEPILIEMINEHENIDEVVVTGIVNRRKEVFSGSTATFSGEELRGIGNQNVLQSLRTLDPSFIMVDNNLSGSDPNALPRIELRGKSSVIKENNFGVLTDEYSRDPNSPLFILDGFEATLRQITDLDMNRIASVTLLKDAASTALYGARSANGVVVVETIKPKPGQLYLSYTADVGFDIPNLRDYNLMNAEEKLEYERLAGRYESKSFAKEDFVMLERFYNERLKAVKEGVNTYWLVKPLRNVATTQNHSLNAEGGSQEFQYNIGGNYNKMPGVMKGSDRTTWGARVNINYRTGKFNFNNNSYVSGYKAYNSPYGSFSTYAQINPYYKSEIVGRYVEQTPSGYDGNTPFNVPNPLYNSQLNSVSYNSNFLVTNNIGFNYMIDNSIRLDGAFQLSKIIDNGVNFVSPLDTRFDHVVNEQKGTYQHSTMNGFNYTGNLQLIYNKIINEKHSLTSNVRAELQEINSSVLGFTAVGFPEGVEGVPSFAYSYKPDSKPEVNISPKVRRVNGLASLNYVFDNRYFFDGTFRIDGSTAFGSSNKFSPFWSAGLGWVTKRESFFKDVNWLDVLTLRGNIGKTGNQNFNSFSSTTVFYLEDDNNDFGQSLYHSSVGNPNLKWQTTRTTSFSLDFGGFNNRLTANLNFYHKYTDPLIVMIDATSSNGILSYPKNTGNMTYKGMEWALKYSPIFETAERKVWTIGITGSNYTSRYDGFNNTLNALNVEMQQSSSIQRFADGRSPDDIWSYKSFGIDPSTGNEVFLTKEGLYTYDYQLADIRVVANSRPVVEGVISSTLRLKGFTFGAYMRYSLGASKFNHALYSKVENISFGDLGYNQDKRALEMRWRESGDIAQFKRISDTDYTPISSRFISKENYFAGESISMGYEVDAKSSPWLAASKFKTLRFSAFMNNIFRVSNILLERGIDYPFANRISFSLNATF